MPNAGEAGAIAEIENWETAYALRVAQIEALKSERRRGLSPQNRERLAAEKSTQAEPEFIDFVESLAI
jgi:hypothetical protein